MNLQDDMSLSIRPIHPLPSESGSQEKASDCWNGFSEIGGMEKREILSCTEKKVHYTL